MADLTNRQLDAEVAEKVMGWPPPEQGVKDFHLCYSTDHEAVAEVRAEIERRGLELEFTRNLRLVGPNVIWASLNATPEQQCRAALAAVEPLERLR